MRGVASTDAAKHGELKAQHASPVVDPSQLSDAAPYRRDGKIDCKSKLYSVKDFVDACNEVILRMRVGVALAPPTRFSSLMFWIASRRFEASGGFGADSSPEGLGHL